MFSMAVAAVRKRRFAAAADRSDTCRWPAARDRCSAVSWFSAANARIVSMFIRLSATCPDTRDHFLALVDELLTGDCAVKSWRRS